MTNSEAATRKKLTMDKKSGKIPPTKDIETLSVMEFIGLHNIPYIFLSPDEPLHVFLAKFLISPNQFCNLSFFVPLALFL